MAKPVTATSNKPANKPGDRVAPVLAAVRADIPMPDKIAKRGSTTSYPFASLEIGQSFGVANKTAKQLSSIVSNQNRKPGPVMLDANNQPMYKMKDITDPNGAVIGQTKTDEKITDDTKKKKFVAADVDPKTDPDKASVRVWRIA